MYVAKNEKGKEARNYFIKAEGALKTIVKNSVQKIDVSKKLGIQEMNAKARLNNSIARKGEYIKMVDRLEELNSMNFKKLTVKDCMNLYKNNYIMVCMKGEIIKILEEEIKNKIIMED